MSRYKDATIMTAWRMCVAIKIYIGVVYMCEATSGYNIPNNKTSEINHQGDTIRRYNVITDKLL